MIVPFDPPLSLSLPLPPGIEEADERLLFVNSTALNRRMRLSAVRKLVFFLLESEERDRVKVDFGRAEALVVVGCEGEKKIFD